MHNLLYLRTNNKRITDRPCYNTRTMPTPERNTQTATLFFAAAIVCDALSAADRPDGAEMPATLRTTAMVLVACLAAPPILNDYVTEQRLLLGVLLGLAALFGQDEASAGTRFADAVYAALALGLIGFVFGDFRFDFDDAAAAPRTSTSAAPFVRREAVANVAVAMLAYGSVRTLRRGVQHPNAARSHLVAVRGYDGTLTLETGAAYADASTGAALCFGGASGVALALALFLSEEFRTRGTAAATLVIATGAFAQISAAFVATMSYAEQLQQLPALYTPNACGEAGGACRIAWESRRFAVVNSSAAALWLNGLGALVLAYAPSLRVHSRADLYVTHINFTAVIYALIAITVCTFVLFTQLSFTGAHAWTDWAAVLAVSALAATTVIDSATGALLFAVAVGGDQLLMIYEHGFLSVYNHLTHVTNSFVVALLLFHATVLIGSDVLSRTKCISKSAERTLDRIVGVVAISGTSGAAFLYTATSALQVTYNGVLVRDSQYRAPDARYARTAAAMIMEHWLPLLAWLPIYATRAETKQLDQSTRLWVWYGTPGILLFVWLVAMLASAHNVDDVYGWSLDAGFVLGQLLVGVLPWAGFVWA